MSNKQNNSPQYVDANDYSYSSSYGDGHARMKEQEVLTSEQVFMSASAGWPKSSKSSTAMDLVEFQAKLESVRLALMESDEAASSDNPDPLLMTLRAALMAQAELMTHIGNQARGLQNRISTMVKAKKAKDTLESDIANKILMADIAKLKRENGHLSVQIKGDSLAKERVAKEQKALRLNLSVQVNALKTCDLTIQRLELENDLYVTTLERIEKYDPDWRRKIFPDENLATSSGHSSSDDGIDLILEIVGLDG